MTNTQSFFDELNRKELERRKEVLRRDKEKCEARAREKRNRELALLEDLMVLDRDNERLQYLEAKEELYRLVGARLERESSLAAN